ncbi:MAG: GatB/YqeY domain-containing protein [Gammaproteobacteria bacterium]
MPLKEQLQQDMKNSMRGGDKRRLGAIRLIMAAIKQREVDERVDLDDAGVTAVLDKMAKQRRESIEQYRKAGRDDLVEQESFELEVLKSYLPEQLSDTEIDAMVQEVIQATGASSVRDMGKVMGQLKPRLQGRADMAAVSARIKARLSG